MKPECRSCTHLISQEPILSGKQQLVYRCDHGHFDFESVWTPGRKLPRWFKWSGIFRPNKTVTNAQENCGEYEPKFTERKR